MKYLSGEYYVEVKDQRYKIHPTENNTLRKEIHQNLLELNIKYKMRLRLGEIKKLLGIIKMN